MPHGFFKSIKSAFGGAADRDPWETDRAEFFKAIKKDDLETVTRIGRKYAGECVRWETKLGTPLFVALNSGSLKALRFLLEAGANPNDKQDEDWTPLARAVKSGQHEFARALLDKNANANGVAITKIETDDWGDTEYTRATPLTLAVKKKDKEMIRLLLERGADADKAPGRNELSPLKLARDKGQFEIADLLKRGPALRAAYLQAQQALKLQQAETVKKIAGEAPRENPASNDMADVQIELRITPRRR